MTRLNKKNGYTLGAKLPLAVFFSVGAFFFCQASNFMKKIYPQSETQNSVVCLSPFVCFFSPPTGKYFVSYDLTATCQLVRKIQTQKKRKKRIDISSWQISWAN
jgi:hypothetical protein